MASKGIVRKISTNRSVAYGALGGIIAGLVMIPFRMFIAVAVGMPSDTVLKAMGLMFGAGSSGASIVGIGMHILTSILIGAIFGFVISSINKLRITGMPKGIGEGVITGAIALIVLFLPVSMVIMPPFLMQLVQSMNPGATPQQIMAMMQKGMHTMMGIGVVEHLAYGAVTSAIVLKEARKINSGQL